MNEHDIDVSVVLCALNEQDRIMRQLDALDAQRDAPPFEVVVVDNGSTDATREVVQRWIDRPARAATVKKLVDGSMRRGIPAARNVGAAAATGRLLAFCDADDAVDAGWVAAFAKAVVAPGLAGGQILAVTAAGEPRPDMFSPGLIATNYLSHVSGCNFAILRDCYFSVGGFDEGLPPYGFDDVEFSWRVQNEGLPIVYVPDAAVKFTLSDSRASLRKRLLLGQGRVLMARRFPKYDNSRYTVLSTVADATKTCVRLMQETIRNRSLDRQQASQAVAAVGRIIGAMKYPSRKPVPAPVLIDSIRRPI